MTFLLILLSIPALILCIWAGMWGLIYFIAFLNIITGNGDENKEIFK